MGDSYFFYFNGFQLHLAGYVCYKYHSPEKKLKQLILHKRQQQKVSLIFSKLKETDFSLKVSAAKLFFILKYTYLKHQQTHETFEYCYSTYISGIYTHVKNCTEL